MQPAYRRRSTAICSDSDFELTQLETIFDPLPVHCVTGTVRVQNVALLSEAEAALCVSMTPQRRSEFATGRVLYRQALAALLSEPPEPGSSPASNSSLMEVLRDGRAPIWPEGFSGAITHSQGLVASAAARAPLCVGIDLESARRFSPSTAKRILFDTELEHWQQLEAENNSDMADGSGACNSDAQQSQPNSRGDVHNPTALEPSSQLSPNPKGPRFERATTSQLWAATVFCVKEAFYKAQYQKTGTFLGFDAITVQAHVQSVFGETAHLKPHELRADKDIDLQTTQNTWDSALRAPNLQIELSASTTKLFQAHKISVDTPIFVQVRYLGACLVAAGVAIL